MPKPYRASTTGHALFASRWLAPAILTSVVCFCIGVAAWPRQSGDDPSKLRARATRAVAEGRWDVADANLGRLNDRIPSDWLLLAIVSYNLKHPEAAEAALKHIPTDGPLAAQAALWQGRIELARFLSRPMEESLKKAIRLDPKLAEARRLLVYLYGTQERRQDLLDQFAALAETSPLNFGVIKHWCITHQDVFNEHAKLKEDLEKFLAADPGDRHARMALAMRERRLAHYDRAEELLAPLPDSDADALACRAEVAFDRAGDSTVEGWLAKGPSNHAHLERLRGRLAARRGDRSAALAHYRRSDSLEPNHWETNYGLAHSLPAEDPAAAELTGRRKAQRDLEEMLSTINDNKAPKILICRQLGALCEASAYLLEARAWYRLAITLDPLDREAQQALVRLKAKPN